MAVEHVSELTYTNSDDGVWIKCKPCRWRHNLGYFSTVDSAYAAWQKHISGEAKDSKDVEEA